MRQHLVRRIRRRLRGRWSRTGIRLKLTVAYSALLVLLTLGAMWYVPHVLERQARRQLAEASASLTAMMAYSLVAPLTFADSAAAHEVVEAVVATHPVAFVQVRDAEGFVDLRVGIAPVQGALDRGVLRLREEIRQDGSVIGELRLGISLARLHADLASARLTTLFVGTLLFVFGLLVIMATSTLLTRPLARLALAAERVRAGVPAQRLDLGRRDEIGVLARALNGMIIRLESAYGELQAANRTLEERVEVRTRELRTEVAERSRAEAALRESDRRFRTILSATHAGVALFGPDGSLLECNPALQRMFGVTDFAADTSLMGIIDEADQPRVRTEWRRLLSGETEHFQGELRMRHRDGSLVYGLATGSVVRHPAGNAEFLIAMVEDISELKRLEENVRQAQRMESIGRLAGGIAHDFNNLLTAINGISELALSEISSDASVHADLTEIRRAGERAAALTRQLLAFSRQQVLQPRVLCINSVVDELAVMLRRLIGENVELVLALDPALRTVRADPGQVSQVIMNLVVNARDAMPEGGTLRITTGHRVVSASAARELGLAGPDEYVTLSVTDTGCGMDADTRARIFEPFFTSKPLGRGTGLGLATVYGIVRQSEGAISVESAPGQGSRFTILLPCAGAAVEPAESRTAAPPEPGSERILVVEDEPAVRALVVRVLRRTGYTVLEASNGRVALDLLGDNENAIDLLLTDVVMPELGGPELVQRLRQRWPAMPVVFMSGYTPTEVVQRDVNAGVGVFLQKPMTQAQLTSKVRQLLDASSKGHHA